MNAFTQKAKDMNIKAFSIKGVRWFQKSYGNTYHTTYISAQVGDTWVELGKTEMEYGYGDSYIVTGGRWLIENGFIEDLSGAQSAMGNGYQFNHYTFRQANTIGIYVQDVQRKRDL